MPGGAQEYEFGEFTYGKQRILRQHVYKQRQNSPKMFKTFLRNDFSNYKRLHHGRLLWENRKDCGKQLNQG